MFGYVYMRRCTGDDAPVRAAGLATLLLRDHTIDAAAALPLRVHRRRYSLPWV